MKISLIHPTRSRPQKSFMNHARWIDKAVDKNIETIVAVDLSDPKRKEYFNLYAKIYAGMFYEFPANSLVEATNYAAKASNGDILVYLSDDFDCPERWDESIKEEFKKYTGPTLIKVDDCLQRLDVPVLTIPIMNRELYDLLGYFFHPDFRSMHCDEHLYWRAKKLNALQFAPHLKFEHRHVSVGKAEDDETYRRSTANWNHGVSTLAKHKALNFAY
jgi:hypothetical protein